MEVTENFAEKTLTNGGSIHPLIIPSLITAGTGLMNPSINKIGDNFFCILRHVNYTFYHSESKLFQHPWGPLTYIHPEHDMHLRTENYFLELNDNLEIDAYLDIDTSRFDNYDPQWDFVGLEDARLVQWDGKYFISGVRRDTTPNGVGRMELSEIRRNEQNNRVEEASRLRIEATDPNSYCEKNWMPINHLPYHYVKWSNPSEIVKVDPDTGKCNSMISGNVVKPVTRGLRGGSQVIEWKDNQYIAITHEVIFLESEVGRKDAVYRHRFVVWDKDWNVTHISRDFSIMNAHIEFAAGMCYYDNDNILISFGFQDNAAFILKTPVHIIDDFIGERI